MASILALLLVTHVGNLVDVDSRLHQMRPCLAACPARWQCWIRSSLFNSPGARVGLFKVPTRSQNQLPSSGHRQSQTLSLRPTKDSYTIAVKWLLSHLVSDLWRLIIAVWPLTPVILFRLKCKFYSSAFSVRAFQTCNTSNVLNMELRGSMLGTHIRHSPGSFLWVSQMLYPRPGPEGVRFLFLAVFIKLWSFFLVFSLRFFSPLRTDPIARAGPRLLHAIVVGCVGEVAFLGCRHCVICSSRTATIAPMLASCHSSTTWVVVVD